MYYSLKRITLRIFSALPKEISLVFLDKFKTAVFLKKNNFNDLNSLVVKNKNFFPKNNNLIVKPRFGRGSSMIHAISSYSQFKSYLNLYKLKPEDVIVQQFIKGQEYTVFVDTDENGKLKCIVPVKVLRKKGITLHGVTDNKKKIIDFVKKFNTKFKSQNSYNLQLIIKKEKFT